MLRLLGIISHGKYGQFSGLAGEIIECPECTNVSAYPDESNFTVDILYNSSRFKITCKKCNCVFKAKVEGKPNPNIKPPEYDTIDEGYV